VFVCGCERERERENQRIYFSVVLKEIHNLHPNSNIMYIGFDCFFCFQGVMVVALSSLSFLFLYFFPTFFQRNNNAWPLNMHLINQTRPLNVHLNNQSHGMSLGT